MKRDPQTFSSCHLQLQAENVEPQTFIYDKMARSGFHKYKRNTPHIMRYHTIARIHFAGYKQFHIDELIDALHNDYGYSNSRESKRRVLEQLRQAPQWFKDLGDGYFSQKSWRKITGVKRRGGKFVTIDLSILHKKNAAKWTDLLIELAAHEQIGPVDTIGNHTGYKRTRLYRAFQTAQIERYKVRNIISIHNTLEDAQAERKRFWKRHQLTEIFHENEHYILTVCTGLSFNTNKDADATGMSAPGGGGSIKLIKAAADKVRKKTRVTTVFSAVKDDYRTLVNAVTGQAERFLYAEFVSIDAGDAFLKRHDKREKEKAVKICA